MSIVNCYKCSKHCDLDYNSEDMVYQNENFYCLECAVPRCYCYSVRNLDASYWNTWHGGNIKAMSQDEAVDLLCEQYNIQWSDREKHIKLFDGGTWSGFIRDMEKYGN